MSGLLQAFVDGFINPLTTPAHVLVLLALALATIVGLRAPTVTRRFRLAN